jgi:hypothetical protein
MSPGGRGASRSIAGGSAAGQVEQPEAAIFVPPGGVAERLNAPVLKTGSGRQGHSWVRIPPPPLREPKPAWLASARPLVGDGTGQLPVTNASASAKRPHMTKTARSVISGGISPVCVATRYRWSLASWSIDPSRGRRVSRPGRGGNVVESGMLPVAASWSRTHINAESGLISCPRLKQAQVGCIVVALQEVDVGGRSGSASWHPAEWGVRFAILRLRVTAMVCVGAGHAV